MITSVRDKKAELSEDVAKPRCLTAKLWLFCCISISVHSAISNTTICSSSRVRWSRISRRPCLITALWIMQETLFLPSSDNELYNLHATNLYRHISCHRWHGFLYHALCFWHIDGCFLTSHEFSYYIWRMIMTILPIRSFHSQQYVL